MEQKKYSIEKVQLGSRLREIRESSGFSQEKFAELLGITESGYKKVELGENNISLPTLKKLHKLMSVSADFILYGNMNNPEGIWENILNCSERDKFALMLKLYFYFTETKRAIYPLKEEQEEADKFLEQMRKLLQDNRVK